MWSRSLRQRSYAALCRARKGLLDAQTIAMDAGDEGAVEDLAEHIKALSGHIEHALGERTRPPARPKGQTSLGS